MSYDSSKSKYYVDLPFGCLKKYAAIKFSKTEVVDDLIEFSYSLTSKNSDNRKLTASFSGSNSNYFYKIDIKLFLIVVFITIKIIYKKSRYY